MKGRAALVALILVGGCAVAPPPASPKPYAIVLGTAQDGGLPQLAGDDLNDVAARQDAARRRLTTSLLVVDPRSHRRWLFDATPDIREQVEFTREHEWPQPTNPGGRPPLFDGIFLTHAHVGHYAGLIHLGREAYAAAGQRVFATASMRRFLETNGPWDLLVRANHVTIETVMPDTPVTLAPGLTVTPFVVPHRGEYSDTVGFLIRGPSRAVAYLPDIDKWERWDRPIESLLAQADEALVDGTFFDGSELPGRAMSEIPHPFIVETIARLASLPASERRKVVFTHLNHSNPAADPAGAAADLIRAAGHRLAADGERLDL